MSTIAIPGFGTKLANGGTAGSSYTNISQVTDAKMSLGKAANDDVTNFDSAPSAGGAVNQELFKTMVKASSISFGMVFNPTDPTQQAVAANLQAGSTTATNFWRLTTQDGTTYVFQGYIEMDDTDLKYDKAIVAKASIQVTGPVTITWS
jgi:hypothetical protein